MKRIKGLQIDSVEKSGLEGYRRTLVKIANSRFWNQNTFLLEMTEETQSSVVKVVEITQDNFESQFALIKQSIDESAFVAFDMEFSGLERSGVSKAIQVDTVGVSFFE